MGRSLVELVAVVDFARGIVPDEVLWSVRAAWFGNVNSTAVPALNASARSDKENKNEEEGKGTILITRPVWY